MNKLLATVTIALAEAGISHRVERLDDQRVVVEWLTPEESRRESITERHYSPNQDSSCARSGEE